MTRNGSVNRLDAVGNCMLLALCANLLPNHATSRAVHIYCAAPLLNGGEPYLQPAMKTIALSSRQRITATMIAGSILLSSLAVALAQSASTPPAESPSAAPPANAPAPAATADPAAPGGARGGRPVRAQVDWRQPHLRLLRKGWPNSRCRQKNSTSRAPTSRTAKSRSSSTTRRRSRDESIFKGSGLTNHHLGGMDVKRGNFERRSELSEKSSGAARSSSPDERCPVVHAAWAESS